jgi:hypothetical protein
MQQEKPSADYDGIYFLPGDEEGELVLSYFDFNDEMAGGEPIENTNYGSKYHIAFFSEVKMANQFLMNRLRPFLAIQLNISKI